MNIVRYVLSIALVIGIYTETGPFTALGFMFIALAFEMMGRILSDG